MCTCRVLKRKTTVHTIEGWMSCSLTLEDRQKIVQDFAESGREATQKKYASHIKRFLVLLPHFVQKS